MEPFVIGVSATDLDGDKLFLDCKGGDKFTDQGGGRGTFEWVAPSIRQTTSYSFTCTASDGKLVTTSSITITVSP